MGQQGEVPQNEEDLKFGRKAVKEGLRWDSRLWEEMSEIQVEK